MEYSSNSDQSVGRFIFVRHSESEYIKHFEDRIKREAVEREKAGDEYIQRSKQGIEIAHNLDALQPNFIDSILTKSGMDKCEKAGSELVSQNI